MKNRCLKIPFSEVVNTLLPATAISLLYDYSLTKSDRGIFAPVIRSGNYFRGQPALRLHVHNSVASTEFLSAEPSTIP